jgi:cytidyltransferase-like protein
MALSVLNVEVFVNLERCDGAWYKDWAMAYITFEDLPQLREQYHDKKIVFVTGTFDIPHAGHALFFESAKAQGDILVVMVAPDEAIKRDKSPHRPVVNEHMRRKIVDSLKPVDYTFMDPFVKIDWPPVENFIRYFEILKPDVYVVNDDAWKLAERQAIAERCGVTMVVLPRIAPPEFNKVSTTGIIEWTKKLG